MQNSRCNRIEKYFNGRGKVKNNYFPNSFSVEYKEIHYRLFIVYTHLSDTFYNVSILKGSLREVEHAQTLFHIQECSVQSYDNS